ncbi:NAD(P)-binding protein [Lentinula raphanica]|nr:NAD(P)-binding protein [Lentinula raphanica]
MLQASIPRVAFITGAAQGIGKAIALRLASDGFKVAINDIHSKADQLESVAEDIKKTHGIETCAVPGDVSVEHEVESMVGSAAKTLGSLDVMVANAGISGPHTPILSTVEEEWDKVQRINTKGVFLCYKHAAKQMIAQGRPGGRIIGASSVAGKQGMIHVGAYVASKFAVRGLMQVAALEFGHHGITVNAYAPGGVESPMAHTTDLLTSEIGKAFFKSLPSFSTLGKVDDIASLVSYLASQESGYITGQTISVNGGMYFD